MKVYRLEADPDVYETLFTPNEDDYDMFRRLDGSPRRVGWVPIRVAVFHSKTDPRIMKPCDFPYLKSNAPVCSLRAVEVLQDFLEENGEILPLLCDSGNYFLYNVTNVVDALDEERSQIKRFSSGRIMNVRKHEFKSERLGGLPVFRLTQMPKDAVFVTQEFVQQVQEKGLVGFGFVPVWEG